MNTPTQDPLPGLFWPPKLPRAKGQTPRTYRTPEVCLMTLREVSPESPLLDGPAQLAAYVTGQIMSRPEYPRHIETLMAIAVNTRRRLIAHTVLATGTQDTILVHPREVFRFAVMAGAHSIGIAHNHPSGDPTPSEGDIRVTRDLARAGRFVGRSGGAAAGIDYESPRSAGTGTGAGGGRKRTRNPGLPRPAARCGERKPSLYPAPQSRDLIA